MAGTLLVQEAGGLVTRFDGSAVGLRADQVVAANPALHRRMLDVLSGEVRRAVAHED
jgi:fructose-1,6-bisphosphatase/inositol monophosphatase family enzyme